MMPKTKLTFEQWLRKIDKILTAKLGLSYQDLPDCCYADWYEDGVTPRGAASRAIKAAKE